MAVVRDQSVFLSYASDCEAFARRLRARLELEREQPWANLWLEHFVLNDVVDARRRIQEAMSRAGVAILVLSPKILASSFLENECVLARDLGIRVCSIISPSVEVASLPEWVRQTQVIDPVHEWPALIGALGLPRHRQGPPFVAPNVPRAFCGSTTVLDALKERILDPNREVRLALLGGSQSGKTALAAAFCQDREVQRTFQDGIVWVGVDRGRKRLLHSLNTACVALTHQDIEFHDVGEAASHLVKEMQFRNCLVVFDGGVLSQQPWWPSTGSRGALLLTGSAEKLPCPVDTFVVSDLAASRVPVSFLFPPSWKNQRLDFEVMVDEIEVVHPPGERLPDSFVCDVRQGLELGGVLTTDDILMPRGYSFQDEPVRAIARVGSPAPGNALEGGSLASKVASHVVRGVLRFFPGVRAVDLLTRAGAGHTELDHPRPGSRPTDDVSVDVGITLEEPEGEESPRVFDAVKRPLIWIEGDRPERLRVEERAVVCIQMGDPKLRASLVTGTAGDVNVSDIPVGGLETEWVVSSRTVELDACDDDQVEIECDRGIWLARFRLSIPRRGESAIRRLGVKPRRGGDEHRLLVVVRALDPRRAYVLSEIYRMLSVPLPMEKTRWVDEPAALVGHATAGVS